MTGLDADVIVVGGGATGSAAAWQLAERGVDVLLLERLEAGPGHDAAGSFRLAYPDPVHLALAQEALRLWRELERASGSSLLTVTGGVDHGGSTRLQDLHAGLESAGIASHWLSRDEVEQRWPGLVVDTRALYHPGSGRVQADSAVAALQRVASSRGAVVRHGTRVTGIRVVDADSVEVTTLPGERLRARRAVVAVGAWTAPLLVGVVPLPRLRVTQEQPAYFSTADEARWPGFRHLLAPDAPGHDKFRGGVRGVAATGQGVKVGFHASGPKVDPDHLDPLPRAEQAAALEEYVRTWLPGLDGSTGVPLSGTAMRSRDSAFVLDRQGPVAVAAGFSGDGFTFVPAIGRVLADLAVDGVRPDPIFSIDRSRRAAAVAG